MTSTTLTSTGRIECEVSQKLITGFDELYKKYNKTEKFSNPIFAPVIPFDYSTKISLKCIYTIPFKDIIISVDDFRQRLKHAFTMYDVVWSADDHDLFFSCHVIEDFVDEHISVEIFSIPYEDSYRNFIEIKGNHSISKKIAMNCGFIALQEHIQQFNDLCDLLDLLDFEKDTITQTMNNEIEHIQHMLDDTSHYHVIKTGLKAAAYLINDMYELSLGNISKRFDDSKPESELILKDLIMQFPIIYLPIIKRVIYFASSEYTSISSISLSVLLDAIDKFPDWAPLTKTIRIHSNGGLTQLLFTKYFD